MTVCAAVRIKDSNNVLICTDSAVGYESGYRREMQEPKMWDDLTDVCVVLESGSDFALSRVHHLFHQMIDKDADNADPSILAECVRQVQKDVAGDDPIESIECELLFCDGENITVVGGDGGVVNYSDYAVIGHGQPPCNVALNMAFQKFGFTRTEKHSRMILQYAFELTAIAAESVCAPFHFRLIRF